MAAKEPFEESWFRNILRNLKIYLTMQKMRVLVQSEKKLMIIGTVVNMVITFAVYAGFWIVVLSQAANSSLFGSLGKWGLGETIVLLSFAEMAFALDNLTFYGLYSLDSYTTEYGLEYELVKPIDPIFSIMGKESEPLEGVVGLSLSFLMFVGAVMAYHLNVGVINFLSGAFALILGNILMGMVTISLSSASLFVGKLESLNSLLSAFYTEFIRAPLDVFPSLFRIFCYVFPLIFVATIPAMLALGMLSCEQTLLTFVAEALLIVFWNRVSYVSWKRALKRYTPTGG